MRRWQTNTEQCVVLTPLARTAPGQRRGGKDDAKPSPAAEVSNG